MKINAIILVLSFLVSCASKEKSKIPYSAVSIDKESKSVDHVSINHSEDQLNPDDEEVDEEEEKKYTLVFGPGLYLTGGYLPVIRRIEDQKENFLSVTGHGLGAYFAAMFAFGFKSDFIEWNFYKFLEETKNMRVLSKRWKQAFIEILLDDLKDKKIEEAQINLILPVFSKERRKVEWIETGDLSKAVMANIEFASHREKYSAAFPWEFFSPFYFRNKGESEFVAVLSIHSVPKFKRPDGFLNGVYTKAVSNYMRTEELFSKVYKLPIEQYQIDAPLKSISENRELIDFVEELTSQLDNFESDNVLKEDEADE